MTALARLLHRSGVCALLFFADPLEGASRDVPPVRPGRIAVLGDSLSVSPSRSLGFPSLLQQQLATAGLRWEVINAGLNGDTTTGGLRRLDALLRERPDVLVLALGANDGLRGVPTRTVRDNLSTIITRAQAQGVKVLLCGMETPPLRGWAYTLEFHNLFPQLAREHDVPLVPFLLAGVVGIRDLNQDDLIHPNARGARRIADTVWPFLERVVRGTAVRS